MKLELKHIIGYLPYGLKGISTEENIGIETIKGFSTYGKFNTVNIITDIDDIDIELFKPILRPLDLTKEIEVNGVKFVPKDWLRINYIGENIGLNLATWSYRTIEKLYEWHFDIHGLIEKGLAIDINTLKS